MTPPGFDSVFEWYVLGFLGLVFVAAWATSRARRRFSLASRRNVTCPHCGRVAHPPSRVLRIRCRGCGVKFETMPCE
jgi:hypothetical protein